MRIFAPVVLILIGLGGMGLGTKIDINFISIVGLVLFLVGLGWIGLRSFFDNEL